jgi:hypothetical protein
MKGSFLKTEWFVDLVCFFIVAGFGSLILIFSPWIVLTVAGLAIIVFSVYILLLAIIALLNQWPS